MSVTWLDAPGSTLPSTSEAIDFRATTDPIAISVSFGDGRIEERAYREGRWLYPYGASTRLADLYTLRRAGGWPGAFRVYVDECVIVSPGVIIGSGDSVVTASGERVVP